MATLTSNRIRIGVDRAQLVTFIGTGTSWHACSPTFTPNGLAGVSIGGATVVSDTQPTATVTTGAAQGLATITDSTTSATTAIKIAPVLYRGDFVRTALRRRYETEARQRVRANDETNETDV
jgi:hypothetical protein